MLAALAAGTVVLAAAAAGAVLSVDDGDLNGRVHCNSKAVEKFADDGL